MDDVKLNSIFFDLDRLVFCTVAEIGLMCNGKRINYIKIDYDNFKHVPVYISDYSLLDKSKFIPVRSVEEKLVISLKYQ
jgi:hypothetical protein